MQIPNKYVGVQKIDNRAPKRRKITKDLNTHMYMLSSISQRKTYVSEYLVLVHIEQKKNVN